MVAGKKIAKGWAASVELVVWLGTPALAGAQSRQGECRVTERKYPLDLASQE